MTLIDGVAETARVRDLIEELLASPRQLGPDYQPIVRLSDGAVIGVKATGRGKPGTELADTLSLLAGAQSIGLVERLDWAFRGLAFDDLRSRPDLELHITPEADTFGTLCPPRHAALFNAAKRELKVVAEIHRDALDDLARLRRGIDDMRSWGWRIAVADLGDDPAAWSTVRSIQPDLIQIDLSSPTRRAEGHAAAPAMTASDLGCGLMAIGVDSPSARTAALGLEIETGRGNALGEAVDWSQFAASTSKG